jgi:hypothetical protein
VKPVARLFALLAVAGFLTMSSADAPSQAGAADRPGIAVPLVKASALQQLAMRTPTHGYGLFTSWGGKYCQDVVGDTSNGGATFSSFVLVQRWTCNGTFPEDSLALDGLGDVFVYGHGFFASYDDGATWVAVPHTGHVLQVVAIGQSVWIVEALCGPHATQTCPLRVATSWDGGRNWTIPPVQPTGAVGFASTQAPVQGETWLVRQGATAYVLSHGSEKYESTTTSPYWVTTNGGAAWQRRVLTCAAGVGSLVMSAAPDGTLFAVCGSGVSAGSEDKSTSVSFDEGRTWRVVTSCLTDARAAKLCVGYLGSVDAVSRSDGYVTGWRSPLHVTHNAGASWTDPGQVGNPNGSPAQVYFFNSSDGFALGELNTEASPVAIWWTHDGGKRWTMRLPVTT